MVHAIAHGGCTDTVTESALKADSEKEKEKKEKKAAKTKTNIRRKKKKKKKKKKNAAPGNRTRVNTAPGFSIRRSAS